MRSRVRSLSGLGFLILLAVFVSTSSAWGQAQEYPFSAGFGQLNYNVGVNSPSCTVGSPPRQQHVHYSLYSYSNFSYVSATGTTTPLGISASAVANSPGGPGCPANGGSTVTATGSGYVFTVVPEAGTINATLNLPGYINPKYVVVGVVYAPPGSKSSVDYTNSTMVSNTSSVSNTFMSSVTSTVSVTTPGGLFGFLGGTKTTTFSQTLSQQNQDSKSVTASYTDTASLQLSGPGPSNNCGPSAGDFIGVDHDCDLIKVWVNPVALFTLVTTGPNFTEAQWNGYGFSTLDPTAPIHIVDILVGCLNSDIAPTDSRCAPALGEFQRTWAANEIWPSGQGPGLTQADLNNILAADPWGQCKPTSPIGSSACPTFSSGFALLPPHFFLSDLENVPYSEGSPQTNWKIATMSSTTQGEESQTGYSETYGVESAFKGTDFLEGFGASVSLSETFSFKYEVNNQTTVSNMFTGDANITGPACSGNPCSPAYPPSSPVYGQGTEFDIFIDNFFGTFVFVPSSYN